MLMQLIFSYFTVWQFHLYNHNSYLYTLQSLLLKEKHDINLKISYYIGICGHFNNYTILTNTLQKA